MTLQRHADGGWTLTCAECGHWLGATLLTKVLLAAEAAGWHLPRLPGNVTPDLAGVHRCKQCVATTEGE